jgi:hypothetical protein
MRWWLSNRADPKARALADRHYSRQSVGAVGFVPPGRCLVLVTSPADAFWVTSYPFAEYVRHKWAGAWVCSAFRNEGSHLSSELIREAVACTLWRWSPPPLGMITFVDCGKVRHKRDPGRCYLRAGFTYAACPEHAGNTEKKACAACRSETEGGLLALQLLSDAMPEPHAPRRHSDAQMALFA